MQEGTIPFFSLQIWLNYTKLSIIAGYRLAKSPSRYRWNTQFLVKFTQYHPIQHPFSISQLHVCWLGHTMTLFFLIFPMGFLGFLKFSKAVVQWHCSMGSADPGISPASPWPSSLGLGAHGHSSGTLHLHAGDCLGSSDAANHPGVKKGVSTAMGVPQQSDGFC